MDIDTIVQLINNVGFPICISIALFYKMNEDSKNHKAEIDSLINAHREEISSLKEIMTEVKIAITELKDKISND